MSQPAGTPTIILSGAGPDSSKTAYLQAAHEIRLQIAILTPRDAARLLLNYPGPQEGDNVDQAVRAWVQTLLRERICAVEQVERPGRVPRVTLN